VSSLAEFERRFGPSEPGWPLAEAVRDFFANGGTRAAIVRLFEAKEGDGIARLELAPSDGGAPLALAAASPGAWGNRLEAAVDRVGITAWTAEQFADLKLAPEDLFNLELTLRDGAGAAVASERWLNLTIREDGGETRIDRALASQSWLARLDGALPPAPPGDGAAGQARGGDDGAALTAASYLGDPAVGTGFHRLDQLEQFNLLCVPPDQPGGDLDPAVRQAAAKHCRARRALFVVDPPAGWSELARLGRWAELDPTALGIDLDDARNAAVYFPRAVRAGRPVAPCGAIAGIYARTDLERGGWKAPAGQDAAIRGIDGLEIAVTDKAGEVLNSLGINSLRNLPGKRAVVWGARTLRGADSLNDEYKYVPVRRLALYLEESLYRGTQWAVFEPNAEPLWSALRLQVGTFLHRLWAHGAIFDKFVKCDATTMTQADIDAGRVNIVVGFAPLKPAEFVVVVIQQLAEPRAA
jgi:hypothetical protein